MFSCVFCACIRFYINVNLKNNVSKVKCALGHPMPPFRPTHSDYVDRSSAHTCIYFNFCSCSDFSQCKTKCGRWEQLQFAFLHVGASSVGGLTGAFSHKGFVAVTATFFIIELLDE